MKRTKPRYDTPADRPDPRTPVHIAPDVYVEMRQVARDENRSTVAQVNRALREWLEGRRAS